MKRLLLSMMVAVCLALAGTAIAKTVTIAITSGGFVPRTQALSTGDAVTFVNQDASAHQVVIKGKAAFTCSAGLVLQPGQSTTCTFPNAGTYDVTDANRRGNAWKATITVTAAPTPTISLVAAPKLVIYGGKTTLSGQLASGQSGQTVTLLAIQCGESAQKQIASATTTTNGAFSATVQPLRTTTYAARLRNARSADVVVKVRPRMTLRKLARGKFSVKALAAQSFAGKAVIFQRYAVSTSRWVSVRTVLLKAGPTLTLPINPTVVSQATFRSRVRVGLRVRAILTQAQAGSCYAAGRSPVIRS